MAGQEMALWFILAALLVICAALMAMPFLRSPKQGLPDGLRRLAIYKDQIAALETEGSAGQMAPAEAEAARHELTRRLLDTADALGDDSRNVPAPLTWHRSKVMAVGLFLFLCAGAAGIYALIGRPEIKSSSPTQTAGNTDAAPRRADVDAILAQLERRLKARPDDVQGWQALGWANASLKNYDRSVEAYSRAVALKNSSPDLHSALGEVLTLAADGMVTARAQSEFDAALRLDPADPRARYFNGLAKLQAGNGKAALDDWIALLNTTSADAEWTPALRERTLALAARLGVDLGGRLNPEAHRPTSPGRR
jgi:cytochrome c-type biogenesis protein CcmH